MSTSMEIQISDTHIGHKTAIMFPKNDADYTLNKAQKWLFKTWSKEFLPAIDKLIEIYKPDYKHLSLLGDMGDTDYKGRHPAEFWTRDKSEMVKNATNLFQPLARIVDGIHAVRGTEAHIGEDGGIDERIASEYAEQYDKTTGAKIADSTLIYKGLSKAGQFAEFFLSGVHFEIAHHGRNRSKWTGENGLNSLSAEILLSRTKTKDKVPDVVSRGHFHFSGDTSLDKVPYVVAVPSWQLPTNFVFRIDPTVATPHVGGRVIIVQDGEVILSKALTYQYPRDKAVVLCK